MSALSEGGNMKTYEFTVVLANVTEITDDMADALFEAGCDDCSPGSSEGIVEIDFDREAASLEEAIRSAIANVQTAGYTAKRVVIDADAELLKV